MTILINLLKSLGIIGISVVISLAAAVIRGYSIIIKDDDGARRFIIFSIILGIIGGIIFSILIVWLHK